MIHCNQDDGDDEECNGGVDVLAQPENLGLRTSDGAFAQFWQKVQARQLTHRPQHLTWKRRVATFSRSRPRILHATVRLASERAVNKKSGAIAATRASVDLGVFATQLCAPCVRRNAIGVVSSKEPR